MIKKATELVAGDIVVWCNDEDQTMYKIESTTEEINSFGKISIAIALLPETKRGFSKGHPYTFRSMKHNEFTVFSTKKEAKAYINAWINENTDEYLPFFVYGTLRRAYGNYRLLAGNTVAEMPATTKGLMWHMKSSIPYVSEGDGIIVGELMYVDKKSYLQILSRVDSLEGYRKGSNWNHYDRKKIVATLEDGSKVDAWCYFMSSTDYRGNIIEDPADKGYERIMSGDYAKYKGSQRMISYY